MRHHRTRDLADLIGGDPDEFREKSSNPQKSIPTTPNIPATLSTRQAAQFFGVQQQTIQQLIAKGVFEPLPSGRLDTKLAVRAYIAAVRKGTGSTLEAAKIRVAEEQAAKLTLQNAAARRELLPAGEVEREWSNALRDLRAALLALPSRLQQRLPHLTPHDVAAFDREIRDALTELAGEESDDA